MKIPDYDLQSLKDSIQHRKKTIKNLKQAIDGENKQIEIERGLIDVIKHKQKLAEGLVIDANSLN